MEISQKCVYDAASYLTKAKLLYNNKFYALEEKDSDIEEVKVDAKEKDKYLENKDSNIEEVKVDTKEKDKYLENKDSFMDDIFLSIFLTSFICLIVGLIRPSIFRFLIKNEMTRKKIVLIFGFATVFSFILFGVFSDVEKVKVDTTEKDKHQENYNLNYTARLLDNNKVEYKITTDIPGEVEVEVKLVHEETNELPDDPSYRLFLELERSKIIVLTNGYALAIISNVDKLPRGNYDAYIKVRDLKDSMFKNTDITENFTSDVTKIFLDNKNKILFLDNKKIPWTSYDLEAFDYYEKLYKELLSFKDKDSFLFYGFAKESYRTWRDKTQEARKKYRKQQIKLDLYFDHLRSMAREII